MRPEGVSLWERPVFGDVAEHWLRLFPKQRNQDGSPKTPTDAEVRMITSDKKRLAELRLRLSDISWWMRFLAENIARRSNQEEGCPGRFWQGRFKAQLLLDEASLLACAAYVDLNPVRAALAESLEQSDYTGIKDRIDDLKQQSPEQDRPKQGSPSADSWTRAWERSRERQRSGWLAPVEIDEHRDPSGPDCSDGGRRASDMGFLSSISLTKYLELLDWTGRQVRLGKAGEYSLGASTDSRTTRPGTGCLVRPGPEVWSAVQASSRLACEPGRRGDSPRPFLAAASGPIRVRR